MSSQQALDKLVDDIHAELRVSYSQLDLNKNNGGSRWPIGQGNEWRWFCNVPFLKRTFGLENETSLITWISLVVSLAHFAMLAFCGEILVQVSCTDV